MGKSFLIKRTPEQLVVRKEELLKSLEMPYEMFMLKVASELPLSNREWQIMTELESIDYLLGEDSKS